MIIKRHIERMSENNLKIFIHLFHLHKYVNTVVNAESQGIAEALRSQMAELIA